MVFMSIFSFYYETLRVIEALLRKHSPAGFRCSPDVISGAFPNHETGSAIPQIAFLSVIFVFVFVMCQKPVLLDLIYSQPTNCPGGISTSPIILVCKRMFGTKGSTGCIKYITRTFKTQRSKGSTLLN